MATRDTWQDWIASGAWHSGAAALPLIPGLLGNVLDMALDDDVEARPLIRLVSREPVLAASVLRLANSAANSPSREVTTIEQAVVRLGTRAVRSAVLSVCFSSFTEKSTSDGTPRLRYIEHGIGTACLAGLVAERSGVDPDEAFVAGLLHDIGKLFLAKLRVQFVSGGGSKPSADEEEAVVREHHAHVGGIAMESWELPSAICAPVRWHHEPERARDFQQMASTIYAANRLSHRFGFGCPKDEETDVVGDPVFIALRLTDAWLAETDGRATILFDAARQVVASPALS